MHTGKLTTSLDDVGCHLGKQVCGEHSATCICQNSQGCMHIAFQSSKLVSLAGNGQHRERLKTVWWLLWFNIWHWFPLFFWTGDMIPRYISVCVTHIGDNDNNVWTGSVLPRRTASKEAANSHQLFLKNVPQSIAHKMSWSRRQLKATRVCNQNHVNSYNSFLIGHCYN